MGTKHVHGAQTYLQANTHPHKIVRIFLLIKKKGIVSQTILTGMLLFELPECEVYTAGTISHVSGYQRTAWRSHRNGSCWRPFFSLADGCLLLVSSQKRQSSFSYMAITLWIRTILKASFNWHLSLTPNLYYMASFHWNHISAPLLEWYSYFSLYYLFYRYFLY